MNTTRRQFLKGVAVAYAASLVPIDVYGLRTAEAELMFPNPAIPGQEFEVRITGGKMVKWPKSVVWAGSHEILPSGGVDYFRFMTPDGGKKWYGTAMLDFS